jgi:hypothetical protein
MLYVASHGGFVGGREVIFPTRLRKKKTRLKYLIPNRKKIQHPLIRNQILPVYSVAMLLKAGFDFVSKQSDRAKLGFS